MEKLDDDLAAGMALCPMADWSELSIQEAAEKFLLAVGRATTAEICAALRRRGRALGRRQDSAALVYRRLTAEPSRFRRGKGFWYARQSETRA